MEIEKGINPNCSELVVRLPPWNDVAELGSLFRELERITSWKAGCSEHFVDTDEGSFHINAPVPIEKIRLGEVSDMENCPYVRLGDVPEPGQSKGTSERVGEKLRYGVNGAGKLLAKGFWCKMQEVPVPRRKEPVGLIPRGKLRTEKVVARKPTSIIESVRVRAHDGYEEHPALQAWQHCYEPHFEPLAEVARALGAGWHTHDGGSPDSFRSWCRKNGFDDVAGKLGC